MEKNDPETGRDAYLANSRIWPMVTGVNVSRLRTTIDLHRYRLWFLDHYGEITSVTVGVCRFALSA
jgi:hypothetical protein